MIFSRLFVKKKKKEQIFVKKKKINNNRQQVNITILFTNIKACKYDIVIQEGDDMLDFSLNALCHCLACDKNYRKQDIM